MMTREQEILFKQKLLNTLSAFAELCNRQKIKYIGAYGTVLGAVRHNGLIPWDDDIDVCMLREDYDAFIKLKNKINETQYYIVDDQDEGYYLPYAKFCDRSTTLWEEKRNPFVIGVFIDVFPVDYVDENISKKLSNDYKRTFYYYSKGLEAFDVKTLFKPKSFAKWIIFKLLIKYNFNKLKKIESDIKSVRGDKCMYYNSSSYEKAVLPLCLLSETINHKFEECEIAIPKDFNLYLTILYGDYMTLPPIEERITHHYHYFVDLEHRYTIDECKMIICHVNS